MIHFWFRDTWYKLSDIFFARTFQVFRNAIKSKKDFIIYKETFSNVSYVTNSNYKLWKYWHIHNVFEVLFLSFLIYGRLLKKKICLFYYSWIYLYIYIYIYILNLNVYEMYIFSKNCFLKIGLSPNSLWTLIAS